MNPGMTTLPEDGSGSGKLVGLVFLIFALCLQFFILFSSHRRYEKWYSVIFILAAGIVFLFKTMRG
ncbi:MAG: hypothetical protein LBV45_00705 [Xanthomonadaceae bacterium]|nr:hypothetical protein [Xanthomonadaceae bacterium]